MYLLLILTAITLSFSTAYFALNLSNTNLATESEILAIKNLKTEFEKQTKPLLELDFSGLYPSRDSFQLIQPIALLSQKSNYSKPCVKNTEQMTKQYFDKGELWENFRCHKISKLPANFFETAPLIHESGMSYAYLAYQSGNELYSNADWARSNINFFHILELKDLPMASLDGNFKILSKLDKADLLSIINRKANFITHDYYMGRVVKDLDLVYKVFPKEQFENFFRAQNYFLRPINDGEKCFYDDGDYCYEKDTGRLMQVLKKSSLLVFCFSMLVLFLVAVILFRKIKQQKFEEERKKHALRVLTHELRTPIANLLLQVENINRESDQLPQHMLEEFLKIEDEIYRLKRLAEKSRSYLEIQEGEALIAKNLVEIPSMNALLLDLIDPYADRGVEFVPSSFDRGFKVDLYWFNVCLKNLIENALIHGKAPVKVVLVMSDKKMEVQVIDNGTCSYSNIDEIIKSERKIDSKTGLGMGLSIVSTIVKELNGKLILKNHPTTFTMVFEE